jgi:hypothetical protein
MPAAFAITHISRENSAIGLVIRRAPTRHDQSASDRTVRAQLGNLVDGGQMSDVRVEHAVREARSLRRRLTGQVIGGQVIMVLVLAALALSDVGLKWIVVMGFFLSVGTITAMIMEVASGRFISVSPTSWSRQRSRGQRWFGVLCALPLEFGDSRRIADTDSRAAWMIAG